MDWMFGESEPQFVKVKRTAEISECGNFRWWLRRTWTDKGKGVCCFVMLNPSKADALQDDHTIRRCIGFARAWGFATLDVRNLFAYRSTDPKGLKRSDIDVAGGERGLNELAAGLTADKVIVAWGANDVRGRDKLFRTMANQKPLYCLGKTKSGAPLHPLRLRADTVPILW